MGIGTTPSALVAHGIDTTVVEIDPVVYEFAEKYFQLPSNHTKIIADAVTYTADLAKADKRFDYIVHDVFTGGAEPIPLFTLEFLEGLATLLKPDGVIAIVSILLSHSLLGLTDDERITPETSCSHPQDSWWKLSGRYSPSAASFGKKSGRMKKLSRRRDGTLPTW